MPSNIVKTIIVDDEQLARERLRDLLAGREGIEVVAECGDGQSAVRSIEENKPDLVFLDVQMPELDGFGVVEAVGADRMPPVIFVTAHERFALKAFEVHAIDYLLKPFDRERFAAALNRALDHVRKRNDTDLASKMTSLLGDIRSQPRATDRLVVKTDGRVLLVPVDDVDWIESADNYVSVHAGGETHLLRETMNSIEQRLPTDRFMRISRSSIVNVDRIRELQPLFHGDYVVILRNGARLNLSRSHREKLNALLGKAG